MFDKRTRQGFTLVEAMVSTVLILLILIVVGESVRWALRAHRKGEATRQSQVFAREVLNRLVNEMSTAISMGLLPNGGELASGVVYPDYASGLNTPFTGPVYLRERVVKTLANGLSVNVDRAYNRLIFTTPGKRSNQFRDSLTEYVFVEFLVPPRQDAPNQPQHRLYRRTYQVVNDPLAAVIPGLELAGNYEIANPGFFALNVADPLANPNMLEASLSPEQRLERGLIIELPRQDDQLQFSIEHNAATQQRTSPLPRDPAFEPALFTVSVSVSLDKQGENKFLGSHIISQQVTIKSGY